MKQSAVCALATCFSPSRSTGKERDPETGEANGNDYFGARYYASSMGRFMSPDPSGLLAQHAADPQSWNLYAYARNNPLMYLDPDGLDCIYATDNGKGVESIDHNSSSKECGGSGGTWVPGTVTEDHAAYNPNNGQIQAASYDGGKVDFATFKAGATTDGDGNCESGCGGYQFASANAAWLASMEHGGSLGDMMSFAVNRFAPIHGMVIPGSLGRILEQILSGPLDFWNDHWAGPSGMGAPHGQNDWAAMAHDYNYDTNHIKIGMYFDPSISPATARALIQSNNTLMQNSGGLQGAKFRLVFGAIDAFQAHAHDF